MVFLKLSLFCKIYLVLLICWNKMIIWVCSLWFMMYLCCSLLKVCININIIFYFFFMIVKIWEFFVKVFLLFFVDVYIYFMCCFFYDFYNLVCIEFVKYIVLVMGLDLCFIVCDQFVLDKVEVYENYDFYWFDFVLFCMIGQEKKRVVFEEIFDVVGLELVKIYFFVYGKIVMFEVRLKQQLVFNNCDKMW